MVETFKLLRCLIWGACLLLATLCATASGVVTLNPVQPWLSPPLGQVDHWMDLQGQATPQQVSALPAAAWHRSADVLPHGLARGRALWLRLVVAPVAPGEQWYAELGYAYLDRVTLLRQDASGHWQSSSAGNLIPVADWPLRHRLPLFRLDLSAQADTVALVRIENPFNAAAPLRLVSASQLLARERAASLALGLFYGLLVLALLLALAQGVGRGDRAAALYAAVIVCIGVVVGGLSGLNGLIVWPESARLNNLSIVVGSVLLGVALLAFSGAATALRARAPRLGLALKGWCGAGLTLALLIPWLEPVWRLPPACIYGAASVLAAIGVLAWAWRLGDRHAPGLLLAMVCLAPLGAIRLPQALGWVTIDDTLGAALLATSALHLVLTMGVLLSRQHLRSVTARRIRSMDRVDPATGLATQRVAAETLKRMTAQARRRRHQYAILLIELVNLSALRQQLGRPVDQELALRLADRLLGSVREIDSVARVSPTRYMMLIDGPVTEAMVSDMTERALYQACQPFEEIVMDWSPDLRVAVGLLPRHGQRYDKVLDKLAMLLDTVAPGDTRTVFTLG